MAGMAPPVNCGVTDAVGKSVGILSYDRSAADIASLKKSCFSFVIQASQEAGAEEGLFQINKDGKLLRENVSKPFPSGAFTKKSIDVNPVQCVVKIKKTNSSDNLNSYF